MKAPQLQATKGSHQHLPQVQKPRLIQPVRGNEDHQCSLRLHGVTKDAGWSDLRGLEGKLSSVPNVAEEGCLLDGKHTHVTVCLWENMAHVEEWTRTDWGANHDFTSCSWTSGNNRVLDWMYSQSSFLLAGSSGASHLRTSSLTAP